MDQKGPADLPGIVPNLRHKLALERALSASKTASHGFTTSRAAELVAIDLKDALDALGEIIGVTTTEDILDQIFNRFCIGK
jgi:tRNA modification GTPase